MSSSTTSVQTASAKGQVTIPADIRAMIGLEPGGSAQFVTNGRREVQLIAKRRDISHLFGIFGSQEETIDVDAAIMETVWEKNRPQNPRGSE